MIKVIIAEKRKASQAILNSQADNNSLTLISKLTKAISVILPFWQYLLY
jgi:hypothetical protein